METEYYQWYINTGLSKILSNSYVCGKRQIFAKDFAKEWVGYAISLASTAMPKESLFGIAIAKLGSFTLSESQILLIDFFLLLNVNITLDSLWTHLEATSLSLSLYVQYKRTLTKKDASMKENELQHFQSPFTFAVNIQYH